MRVRNLVSRVTGAAAIVSLVAGPVAAAPAPKTPIQHVVVLFQENVSFDHYFATYPIAANSDGNPFKPDSDTPSVNGLQTGALLHQNPNFDGTILNPFRLSFAQAATCDQDHDYTDEQKAFDGGMMDNFKVLNNGSCLPSALNAGHPNDLVMGYYDGNTVTALWNYAQNFAMNDNSFGTTFGPSSPGAINLVAGNNTGAVQDAPANGFIDISNGSLTNDAQPFGDACTTRDSAHLTGQNIGDLMNTAGLSWGWFEEGFDLTVKNPNNTTGCARTHTSATGAFSAKVDYIPHHEPFQYYASTANPTHKRPSSVAAIGTGNDGGVNHQYDLHDFFEALGANNLPAVSFLKAGGYQDGHAGYSTPIDEQTFVVATINALQKSKFWNTTAVIIAYDDSDGWYDHQMSPILQHSQEVTDALTGTSLCGSSALGPQGPGRCGYGPRLPFMVISPWAKTNFVDHTLTDQSSIIAFVEQNWALPHIEGSMDQFAGSIENMFDFTLKKNKVNANKLYLDPVTGEVLKKAPKDSGVENL